MVSRSVRLLALLTASVLSAQTAKPDPQYDVTDLGSLFDGPTVIATAINDAGQIVGSATSSGFADVHPFLWTDGTMQDLGLPEGFIVCRATAINELGHVVGLCQATGGDSQAFVWTPDEGMSTVPFSGSAFAYGINNNDDVIVGACDGQGGESEACVFSSGATIDLGPGTAFGISDQDQIVGVGDQNRAMLWDGAGAFDLGSLEGPDIGVSHAYAVRADGIIAGDSSTGVPGERHAILWTPYGISNLGTLGGPTAAARAIREGLIVGESITASGDLHAFVYDDYSGPGYPVDLNDLIPPDTGWVLAGATGVNAAGQIVGWGFVNHVTRAFLLTPTESATPKVVAAK